MKGAGGGRSAGTINASAALTLSPGTTIEFEQDFGLMIDGGTLIADATGGERITFTAANGETLNGFWKGIYFTNTFSTSNIIANADILYAGSSGWHGGADSQAALFLRGGTGKSSVGLSDVKIANSGYWGLSVESGSVVAPCDSVTFENNTQGPSLLEDPAASACLP